MAESYSTARSQQQEERQTQPGARLSDRSVEAAPVGIYERPAQPMRSMAGLFLLLLVLAILAYFLLQWLR